MLADYDVDGAAFLVFKDGSEAAHGPLAALSAPPPLGAEGLLAAALRYAGDRPGYEEALAKFLATRGLAAGDPRRKALVEAALRAFDAAEELGRACK